MLPVPSAGSDPKQTCATLPGWSERTFVQGQSSDRNAGLSGQSRRSAMHPWFCLFSYDTVTRAYCF